MSETQPLPDQIQTLGLTTVKEYPGPNELVRGEVTIGGKPVASNVETTVVLVSDRIEQR